MSIDIDWKDQGKNLAALHILTEISTATDNVLKQLSDINPGNAKIVELFSQIQTDIEDARERSKTGTIRIGILGGRGSGKSTVANSLMGEEILPDGAVMFCTSLPTAIRYSPKYSLYIESEYHENSRSESDLSQEKLAYELREACSESMNPDNKKRINEIRVGVPSGILAGKEIVDVPGFTKGNSIHQAFAERYAKHLCDVCLVLVNNAEAIEFGSYQGIQALAKAFGERLDAVIFLINKCDQARPSEINFIKDTLCNHLGGLPSTIRNISAKNALSRSGDLYEFTQLFGDLSLLADKRSLVIVRGLIGRLLANFTLLIRLCEFNEPQLTSLAKNISELKSELNPPVNIAIRNLTALRDKYATVQQNAVEWDLSDVPGEGYSQTPEESANKHIDQMQEYFDMVKVFVETRKGQLFREFATSFENDMSDMNKGLNNQLKDVTDRFGLPTPLKIPDIEMAYNPRDFDPTQIERLRPHSFRLWQSQHLPAIWRRQVKLLSFPVRYNLYGAQIEVKVPIPIGLIDESEVARAYRERINKKVQESVENYLKQSLSDMANWAFHRYKEASKQHQNNWGNLLDNYTDQINRAKSLASPEEVNKIQAFINELKSSQQRIEMMKD